MSKFLCLPASFPHDTRLLKMLNAHELRHFLLLLCFASTRRDPTFIPAKKVEELRLTLGLNREKFQKRLDKWAAPGIELILIDEDTGGFLIAYLLDNDDPDDDGEPVYAGSGESGHAPRRQRGRRYSNTPEAQRSRAAYARRKEASDGESIAENRVYIAENRRDSEGAEREVFGENLTAAEEKPHANGAKPHGELREVFSPPYSNSNTVSGVLKNLKDSDYCITVDDPKNLMQNLTPRAALRPEQIPAARAADIAWVMSIGGNPSYRNYWLSLWRHCQASERLDVWDRAVAALEETLVKRPPSGPGAINNRATWLLKALLGLLDAAGCAYVPKSENIQTEEPVSEEESAEIRSAIEETKRRWANEAKGGSAAEEST